MCILSKMVRAQGSPANQPQLIDLLGTLKLELGRELYERTGLTGKPIRSGGRKHAKERYCM